MVAQCFVLNRAQQIRWLWLSMAVARMPNRCMRPVCFSASQRRIAIGYKKCFPSGVPKTVPTYRDELSPLRLPGSTWSCYCRPTPLFIVLETCVWAWIYNVFVQLPSKWSGLPCCPRAGTMWECLAMCTSQKTSIRVQFKISIKKRSLFISASLHRKDTRHVACMFVSTVV